MEILYISHHLFDPQAHMVSTIETLLVDFVSNDLDLYLKVTEVNIYNNSYYYIIINLIGRIHG